MLGSIVFFLILGVALLALSRAAPRGINPAPEPDAVPAQSPETPPAQEAVEETEPATDVADRAPRGTKRRRKRRTQAPAVRSTPATGRPILRPLLQGFGLASLGLALVLAATASVYRLQVGEAGVVRSVSGAVLRTDTTTGFGLKAPWDSVVVFDILNQAVTFHHESTGVTDGGSADLEELSAQTSDNATAKIDVTVRYSIDPQAIESIYRNYRTQDNLLNRLILPDLRSTLREAPTEYPANVMRQQRAEVEGQMFEDLRNGFSDTGVLVENVDLRDIRYDQSVEESLQAIQTARAAVEQARANLDTARLDAEKVRLEAKAQSDADQIIRCGARSSVENQVIAGVEQEVTVVEPFPNEQCQNRLNEQVLTSKYIDMLREAAQSGSAIYVVPPDQSALLQLPAPAP